MCRRCSPPGQERIGRFAKRFVEHRANKTCAVCHDRIDPLGFAFEAYNSRGGFAFAPDVEGQRVRKIGLRDPSEAVDSAKIDTSGMLPTGERFNDLEDLKAILTGSQWPSSGTSSVKRSPTAYAVTSN